MTGAAPDVRPVALRTDLRPYRLAMLVNPTSAESVEKGIRAASSIWGGWRCPLVAVTAGGEVAEDDRYLIELLGCDGLYNFAVDDDGRLRWPTAYRGPAVREPAGDNAWWPAKPSMFADAYPGTFEGQVVTSLPLSKEGVHIERSGASWLWALAAVGGLWAAEDISELNSHGVRIGPPGDPAALVLAQLRRESLLSATARHDVDEEIGFAVGAVLTPVLVTVMGNLDSGSSGSPIASPALPRPAEHDPSLVIRWWNARALRPARTDALISRTVLLPIAAIEDQRVVRAIQEAAYETDCTPALFLTAGPGATPEDLAHVRERLGFPEFSGRYEQGPSSPVQAGPGVALEQPSDRWRVPRTPGIRSSQPAVLTPGGATVRYQPPSAVLPHRSGPVVVRAAARAVIGPRRPGVARLYLPDGRWDADGVSTTLPNLIAPDLKLGSPTPEEVLHACFAEEWKRAPYRLNDKGKQVVGLMQRVISAGVDLKLLRRRAVLAIAQALTPPPDRDLTKAVKALADQRSLSDQDVFDALGRYQRRPAQHFGALFGNPSIKRAVTDRRDLADLLEELARSRLIEMTLGVVCSACGEKGWLPVETAPPLPDCPGCGLPARYVHADRSPEIAYRASTLLTRAYMNGSLVPAAAAVTLAGPMSHVLPGVDFEVRTPRSKAEIKAPSGGTRDLDLLGWRYSQLFVGEAKTNPVAFTEEQLNSSITLAAHVGADVFLVVCPDILPIDVEDRAAKLAERYGMSVEVIAGQTLMV